MMLRSRSCLASTLLMGLALVGSECRAAMTLQFNLQPTTQPQSGSLTREADDTLRATNLAVTSVTSVDTGTSVALSKYMDFQSGPTGFQGVANFFLLDRPIEDLQGNLPTASSKVTGAQKFTQNADGSYLFTMRINYGYVDDVLSDNFGTAGELGWTGLLTLHIAKFDCYLASAQVSSGTIVLTSTDPVPAGEEVTPAEAVPEPASCVMAGLGLVIVAGYRAQTRRIAARA